MKENGQEKISVFLSNGTDIDIFPIHKWSAGFAHKRAFMCLPREMQNDLRKCSLLKCLTHSACSGNTVIPAELEFVFTADFLEIVCFGLFALRRQEHFFEGHLFELCWYLTYIAKAIRISRKCEHTMFFHEFY